MILSIVNVVDLRRFLSQPYPYYYTNENLPRVAALVFVFCFVFLFFFEPFVFYRPEHKFHFFWIAMIQSATPVTVGSSYFALRNFFFKGEEDWKMLDEIIHVSIVLTLIGIGNFLIRDLIYNNPHNWSWRYFYEEISHAFLVGALIVIIFVPANFKRLFRKYRKEAEAVQRSYHSALKPVATGDKVFIKTLVKSDEFDLDVSELLFARAAGNYSELILSNGDKHLKRISIKELESQLAAFPWLVKTHRAYIVNIQKIKDIKGNAQGYMLSFEGDPERAPVSRGMIPSFNRAIQAKP